MYIFVFLGVFLTVSVNGYTDKCYGDLGCFSDRPPFGGTQIRSKGFIPESPEEVNTIFSLFTRRGSNVIITADNVPVAYNSSLPTKFIIHGFIQNADRSWIRDMKNTLLRVEDLNVITVDWRKGADFPYAQAASNCQIAGAEIAKLIKILVSKNGANIDDFHLIGHSLGSHVAGYAGERLENLGRITGLDPAGPLFEFTHPLVRLDKSDAKFVDVIHTDGENILKLGLGLLEPAGHVDFYPNGGVDQPSCPASSYKLLTAIFNFATSNIEDLDNISGCSHVASYKFFMDSIENTKCYAAYPCESRVEFDKGNCLQCSNEKGCNQMGYWSSPSKELGSHYLNTQEATNLPFCTHNYQIGLFSDDSGIQALGRFKISFGKKFSNEQIVDDSENKFTRNSVSKYLLSINERLTTEMMDTIFISYERTGNIFSSWLYDLVWSFKNVEIFSGETQKLLKFCPKMKSSIGPEPDRKSVV